MGADQGELTPDFAAVQAHYDGSASLIRRMIDWDTRMYSCALWTEGATTLANAQRVKVDHTLAKLNLQPGQRLIDTGSGYGFTLRRANELYGVDGVGLTLSIDQAEESRQMAEEINGLTYLQEGWEQHHANYSAAVSIGMAEHVGKEKFPHYLRWVGDALPDGGLFLLHMIFIDRDSIPLDREERTKFAKHIRFLGTDIFPHGYLLALDQLEQLIHESKFNLVSKEFLGQPDYSASQYALTLDAWRKNLIAQEADAIEAVKHDLLTVASSKNEPMNISEAGKNAKALYRMYRDPYLEDTASWFRQGFMNVGQFLLQKAS